MMAAILNYLKAVEFSLECSPFTPVVEKALREAVWCQDVLQD